MFTWPKAETVDAAVRRWAAKVAKERPDVIQIGYFGSYARGDWGVGSDLDLMIIVQHADKPFEMRAGEWDTRDIPVPTDIWVYTLKEWHTLARESPFFTHTAPGVIWIYQRHTPSGQKSG